MLKYLPIRAATVVAAGWIPLVLVFVAGLGVQAFRHRGK